ncbi:MAG: glycosyltransferase [Planctomycetes bacterium]|nr:glycosyltransferase [Planctomycetota bacterium]
MSSHSGLHRSPYVRVVELPETRAWLDAALAHWHGGTILQIGLKDPVVAIELARRGARVHGMDADASNIKKARQSAVAANLNAVCDEFIFTCACVTSESKDTLDPFIQNPADVAVVESLPEGAAITVVLERLSRCARVIVLGNAMKPRMPDRFMKNCLPCDNNSAGDFVILLRGGAYVNDPTAPETEAFTGRVVANDDRSAGERHSNRNCARALDECATEKAERILAVVRDGGFVATGLDAPTLAMREPNANGAAVATATRTDRFSREHISSLRPFDEIWVPSAAQRSAAIASGLPPSQVRVVPDAIDTLQFQPRPKVQRQFRVLAMASNRARLREVSTAARAFHRACGNAPNTILTILCGGDVAPDLLQMELARELGGELPANLELRAALDHEDMAAFYCEFDLFLRPSRGERRATAILEAMACGVPVAATRFGIAGEIVNIQTGYPIDVERTEICNPADESVAADEAGHRRPVPSLASAVDAVSAAYEDWQGRLQRSGAARAFIVATRSIDRVATVIRSIPWELDINKSNAAAPHNSKLSNPKAGAVHNNHATLADAAASTGHAIYCDEGGQPAPRAESLPEAFSARELWCYSRLCAEGWIAAGYPSGKIQFAPPLPPSADFNTNVRPAVLPTRRKIRILADARGDHMSGADLALLAFAQAKIQNSALIYMGARPETRASLEKLAAAQESAVEVVFVAEPNSDIARASLIAACDLVCDLSRGPSNGAFLLETAACGKTAATVAFAQPAAFASHPVFYYIPSKLKISLMAPELFASPPILCEAIVDEAARILAAAVGDAQGRRRRGAAARALSLQFNAGRLQQFVDERANALNAPASDEVTIAFAAPAGTEVPELPTDSKIYLFEAPAARGGLAGEANETLSATDRDFVIFASGGFRAQNMRGGEWARPLVEPLAQDPGLACCVARDPRGAVIAFRPGILRTISFAGEFISPAFLLDFARALADRGDRVQPLGHLAIAFTGGNHAFECESKAVELFAQANEYLQNGEVEHGLDSLLGVVNSFPRYAAALDCAASIFEALGEHEQSIEARRRHVEVVPRDPVSHTKLGELYLSHGDALAASRHLRAARALAPGDAHIEYSYGRSLMQLKQFAEAADVFLNALQIEPDFIDAAEAAADALRQMGKASDALTLLKSYEVQPALPRTPAAAETMKV